MISSAATLPPVNPMRTVRWSFEEYVTAKEDGRGCEREIAPAAVAEPFAPVSRPASPVSLAPTFTEYRAPSKVVVRSAEPSGSPAREIAYSTCKLCAPAACEPTHESARTKITGGVLGGRMAASLSNDRPGSIEPESGEIVTAPGAKGEVRRNAILDVDRFCL